MAEDIKKTSLEQEKEELNALIRKGVNFEVKDIQVVTTKRFFGLIRKRQLVEVVRKFTIEEPTLSTLDRLSSEWIELAIDEKAMKSDDAMVKARTMAHKLILFVAPVLWQSQFLALTASNAQSKAVFRIMSRTPKRSKPLPTCLPVPSSRQDCINSPCWSTQCPTWGIL